MNHTTQPTLWRVFAQSWADDRTDRCAKALVRLHRAQAPVEQLRFAHWMLRTRPRLDAEHLLPPPITDLPASIQHLALDTLFAVGFHAPATRLALRWGHPTWAESLLVHDPLGRAEVAGQRGDRVAQAKALVEARAHRPATELWKQVVDEASDPASLDATVWGSFACGEVALALAAHERLVDRFGRSEPARLWNARIPLWQGRTEHVPLQDLPEGPEGWLLRAIAHALQGELDEATALLDDAHRAAPGHAEIATWRARCAQLAGRPLEALARRALDLARARPLAARLLDTKLTRGKPLASFHEDFGLQLRDVGLRASSATAAVEEVYRRLAGNLSGLWTEPGPDGLIARTLPLHPRARGLRTQKLLETRSLPEVEAQFAAQAEAPLFLTYWGESRLWAGRYEDAAQLFRRALDQAPRTLWARIGLGAAKLYLDDPEGALQTWRSLRFDGPTVFVYRGEALQRLGRDDEAEAQLRWAIRERPRRLGAWLLLARDRPALAEPLVAHLRAHCPHWPELFADEPVRAALASLAGNRSSSTFCAPRGELMQFLAWDPQGWAVSDTGATWLERARQLRAPPRS